MPAADRAAAIALELVQKGGRADRLAGAARDMVVLLGWRYCASPVVGQRKGGRCPASASADRRRRVRTRCPPRPRAAPGPGDRQERRCARDTRYARPGRSGSARGRSQRRRPPAPPGAPSPAGPPARPARRCATRGRPSPPGPQHRPAHPTISAVPPSTAADRARQEVRLADEIRDPGAGRRVVERRRASPAARSGPARMMQIVSLIDSASSWSWVTRTKVMPTSCCRFCSSICISRRSLRSSAASGSSSRSTVGRLTRARASATRCCCPPDSSQTRRAP